MNNLYAILLKEIQSARLQKKERGRQNESTNQLL